MNESTTPRVFDVTVATFEQDVVLKSREVPILLDFWATWCAPCKALGPILEKLAEAYAGAFLLAKVDIDQEQQLAAYFQIRSVPTVMLLHEGRVLDGFPGALPEGQIRQFLAQHGIEPLAQLEQEEAPPDAAAVIASLREAAANEPDQPQHRLELALALAGTEDYAEAEALLDALPANLGADPKVARARSRIETRRVVAGAPPLADLEARYAADPADPETGHLLGLALVFSGRAEEGLEVLLELLRCHRNFGDGLPRRALVDAFNLVEDEDLVRAYRRRMTALLF